METLLDLVYCMLVSVLGGAALGFALVWLLTRAVRARLDAVDGEVRSIDAQITSISSRVAALESPPVNRNKFRTMHD